MTDTQLGVSRVQRGHRGLSLPQSPSVSDLRLFLFPLSTDTEASSERQLKAPSLDGFLGYLQADDLSGRDRWRDEARDR